MITIPIISSSTPLSEIPQDMHARILAAVRPCASDEHAYIFTLMRIVERFPKLDFARFGGSSRSRRLAADKRDER
jgi:hypothetical protein